MRVSIPELCLRAQVVKAYASSQTQPLQFILTFKTVSLPNEQQVLNQRKPPYFFETLEWRGFRV